MKRLSIDFETYSDIDIAKAGLYKYMESPAFEILLIGYAFDDEEPAVLDLTDMTPEEKDRWKHQFEEWLADPEIRCSAYNAEFEINVFSRWFGRNIPLDNWWDTMITALTCGLPRSLKDVGMALDMPEDKAKLAEGKRLVTYFCTPCKPTKANGMRTRNTRQTDPERWAKFVEYNRQDVVAERAIWQKIKVYEPSEDEHRAWIMSTEINRRGVMIDRKMAEEAVEITEEYNALQIERLKSLTGLENPNSNSQLAKWLGIPSVDKESVAEELKTAKGDRREVLQIRREIGKTSVAKYEAMLTSVCKDDRVRGMFLFYGANRSGRYAGRIVQCQNLPQNHIDDLVTARECVKAGDWEALDMLYGNVPDTLSQLIRTAFIAKPGHTFAVADFSAIEARVVAYLTDEKWRQALFAKGGDIYCQSASEMFGVPVVKHGINGELRQKGKIAELACLAYDSPVLTDQGLVPIQDVTTEMKLWDGEEWVAHDGVIYKGERDVITYDGLTATPDHLVWVEEQVHPVPFGWAATRGYHLLGRKDSSVRETKELERHQGKVRVYDIRNAGRRHRFTVSGRLVHNCGYGGSAGAMINMGALKMGLTEEELPEIVAKWREASPHVVEKWWEIDRKVKDSIANGSVNSLGKGMECYRTKKMLCIKLPSGRCIRYYKPRVEIGDYGRENIVYEAYETGKWSTARSYGPKIFENICQAVARDCLIVAMERVTKRYPDIVMHVHDEMIVEVPEAEAEEALKFICACMAEPIPWAPGLLLKGDGYVTKFYRKD